MDEEAVRVRLLQGQGKLGSDDGAHENGLARPHGQRQDIARVVQDESLPEGLHGITVNEGIVPLHAGDNGSGTTAVSHHFQQVRVGEPQGGTVLLGILEKYRERSGIRGVPKTNRRYQ